MTFDEMLDQVRELLQRRSRVTYRSLKLRYQLDDELLAGVTDELIKAERVAVDEDGEVLVWTGGEAEGERAKRRTGEKERDAEPRTLNSEPPSAERRQLTVMFCDLVGSTALSAQLDPEELREVVRGYQEICTEVIRRYEGYIAQHLGDGLLVYFGYPTAHEDDAVRAVRTGLEILVALRSRAHQQAANPPLPHGRGSDTLHVRIGIHTGLVVIGEIGSSEKREILALGETPNLAARIQGQAHPDEVMISAATYRLVEGLFACEDRGQPELKGVTTPLTLYRVVQESKAQSRFDVAVQAGLTPLVGREEELALLRRRWEQATDGEGQVVLLSGEAGIGKSRLVQELKNQVAQNNAVRIEFRCSPYHQNSAFYPLIEHLQRVLEFQQADSPEEKLRKLAVGVRRAVPLQPEAIPLLAALLSLPHPDGVPPLTLSPQKQKQKTQEVLVAWIIEEAEKAVVYCVWEDLHWADPSTLEFLALCLDQVPTARMLLLLTFRPEFTPTWTSRSHVSHLVLSRLGRKQTSAIVEQLTGGALPPEVLQQIVSKTDGVPLFVEELTKMVVESDLGVGATGRSPLPLGIPSTLQDALMARLDRLGTAKEVAQQGAVVGRELTYDLLSAISPLTEAALQQELAKLVEAELLYQRGLPPQATYLFKHALVQETAYQSLLKSKRQQYHQQIAQVFEARFPETTETQPELVAHHYTEAGLVTQAIPYWQQAGQRATQHSANLEAVSHLTKALHLLKTLPDTPERNQQELTLQLVLGAPLMDTKGFAAAEVEKTYARAHELCQQVGEPHQLFPILRGLWVFYSSRMELQTAHEIAEQLLNIAQNVQDPALLVESHMALGLVLLVSGEFAPAQAHLEQGIALYDPKQHRSRALLYGQDSGVICLSYASWAFWFLGYPDQSLKRIRAALTLAQDLSHPFSLAYALGPATSLHQFRREIQAAQKQADSLISLSTEQGFALRLAWGTILRGWALAKQGQEEEGIAQIYQGLAAYRATGAEAGQPCFLAQLAEICGKTRQTAEGLAALAEALAKVNKTGERYYEAELYRLKGELTLQQFKVQGSKFKVADPRPLTPDPQAEAEACFLKAIEIAQRQQAKSLELRAATSLARLWQSQGKRAEAHNLLADVYNWFTEGFDTKDLQEAKALLEELSCNA